MLSFALVPFQGWAALKGLVSKEEGPWFRTPKTGRITDEVHHLRRLHLLRRWLLGHRAAVGEGRRAGARPAAGAAGPVRAVRLGQSAANRRIGWVVVGAIGLAIGALAWRGIDRRAGRGVGRQLPVPAWAPGRRPLVRRLSRWIGR